MNDLLEYGKPTGLELVECRLEDVVAPAVSACSPLAERASAVVRSHLAHDLPPLRVDRRRLTLVFRSLVENALSHSPAGARVELAAELVRRDGAGWIECAIEDSGPGFRDEDLPHVFEPFFTRRHGGSGLALAIAHRIVENHGGSLIARNREQGGASVLISLPTATPAGERR
jgi:signal transduction histidine kinase